MKVVLCLALLMLILSAPRARADATDAGADSVYLVGEFVDPVCSFPHGMEGRMARECALVRGRVEQGIFFLDIRQRKIYPVIGQNHWDDPKQGFLDAIGDTFGIRARVWNRYGSQAIAVNAVYPWREQPPAQARMWPWHWEWSVLAGVGLLAAAYLLAMTRRRRDAGAGAAPIEHGRIAVFLIGLAAVVVALNGPIHDLSDRYLFSAHMIQHLLLSQVFAPLVLLGIPPWMWRSMLRDRRVRRAWNLLAAAPVGFALYTVFFSLWHVPLFYDQMMRHHGLHIAMHLALMGTAVLLWWPIVGGESVDRPLSPPVQLLYLFLLSIPMMGVAALMVFATRPLYEWYAFAPRLWGLSPLEDQKMGALIMWIPGSLYWWGVMTVVWFRWAGREPRDESDPFVHGTT